MKIIRWGADQYGLYWVEIREDEHVSMGTGIKTPAQVSGWLKERGLNLDGAQWMGSLY